jgi:hypothetical protein
MSEHQASRTLVKSPPELWAECSDARSLARHLGDAVGEIRIKRLEPETAVAWEGERISGTVRLEPSGWGTKVTLTAAAEAPEVVRGPEVVEAPQPAEAPEPVAVAEPPATEPPAAEAPAAEPPPTGFIARLRRWFGSAPAEPQAPPAPAAPEPVAAGPAASEPAASEPVVSEPTPSPEPEPAANQVDLTAALDSLGKAHHRPFSRA